MMLAFMLVGFVLGLIQATEGTVKPIDLRHASDECPGDAAGGSIEGVMASGTTHPLPSVPTIEVRLSGLDKPSYRYQDRIELEVLITNRSDVELVVPVLPRSAVCAALREGRRDLRKASVQLRLADGLEGRGFIGVVTLWANDEPSSRVALPPGASIAIKGTTRWSSIDRRLTLPREARVVARVEGIGNVQTVSTNVVGVRIE